MMVMGPDKRVSPLTAGRGQMPFLGKRSKGCGAHCGLGPTGLALRGTGRGGRGAGLGLGDGGRRGASRCGRPGARRGCGPIGPGRGSGRGLGCGRAESRAPPPTEPTEFGYLIFCTLVSAGGMRKERSGDTPEPPCFSSPRSNLFTPLRGYRQDGFSNLSRELPQSPVRGGHHSVARRELLR